MLVADYQSDDEKPPDVTGDTNDETEEEPHVTKVCRAVWAGFCSFMRCTCCYM